jgi:hypothetical protein
MPKTIPPDEAKPKATTKAATKATTKAATKPTTTATTTPTPKPTTTAATKRTTKPTTTKPGASAKPASDEAVKAKAGAAEKPTTGAAAPAAPAGRTPAREERPHSVAIIDPDPELERLPDQPFEESPRTEIDPELRDRLISDAAYRRYAARGFTDGYDVEDWLDAEAEVDHLLLDRKAG